MSSEPVARVRNREIVALIYRDETDRGVEWFIEYVDEVSGKVTTSADSTGVPHPPLGAADIEGIKQIAIGYAAILEAVSGRQRPLGSG